ncbi:Rid family detoxifying hydrolase [Tunicatimonas pelagia]|uniref:Rid family detoxifying hydrolase n=1 Tax=Tunicatimonas pelagia TaxID=931531 RepID=UPI0026657727|nr:Rid family detoxifying hydrolase [Tunicatimonas pelagia]WKN45941.1 Rid family detoxifying hydrolase [Tunicatimonas pelagia]
MPKKIIQTSEAPAPIGPYNQAILVGDTLYASGQIAIDVASGELLTDNITQETHQVMKNLEAVLRQADMQFLNVVKCSIFVRDMGQFATINEAYGQYFQADPPARETVEVSGLPKDVNVEISCIAVK